ncbi:30S ribosomal protein S16 [Gimesia maris]|uniref:Small ribosomal subunit protein bS16 n=1 Tax=Gimesia maris TaxID=122 RepID=A0A3D3R6F2_9PLAN|nr:30S ribosomal protein S16 [Gimesia maris]HAW30775.1 30S ribosomal protein S16 [Planctomycetaceae bacterium]QDT79676.1 30S ribosomal protein S16 [Gimesia maris]QDU15300.1 30S ribosomal protein S16 [Gimesia maris]QEG17274.1 30S ribosomal protein S16 [Gimesia maris]QGQ29629.1 30S ribosomal protein S16 [Gimesia maris]
MAVRIRMKRMGRKHRPFYRICVMDSRKQRDGEAIEEIGTYDTSVADKSKRVEINMERVDYWMSVGAKPSENVATLIKKVKKNKFGTAAAPAPLTAPKEPAPEPEPEAEEASAEATEAGSEEAAAEETPSE